MLILLQEELRSLENAVWKERFHSLIIRSNILLTLFYACLFVLLIIYLKQQLGLRIIYECILHLFEAKLEILEGILF
jgi:hypothetical protein